MLQCSLLLLHCYYHGRISCGTYTCPDVCFAGIPLLVCILCHIQARTLFLLHAGARSHIGLFSAGQCDADVPLCSSLGIQFHGGHRIAAIQELLPRERCHRDGAASHACLCLATIASAMLASYDPGFMRKCSHEELYFRALQVFYEEFGVLMMHQPLIGWDFTTYLPVALVPYMLMLVFSVFNRVASMFTRSVSIEFDDDFETKSGAAAKGLRLLQMELDNHNAGRPLGLTITTSGQCQFAWTKSARPNCWNDTVALTACTFCSMQEGAKPCTI